MSSRYDMSSSVASSSFSSLLLFSPYSSSSSSGALSSDESLDLKGHCVPMASTEQSMKPSESISNDTLFTQYAELWAK
ncbi:hypothetical protein Gotri_005781 [Gossypium trilobum]|uniref:Uncharacterized protein n=1 Tax=Gossypium trilobum TaxID=34281 RepID=A0A7J9EY58_9ROSI|nr:hypothetical protein [Gossypium trilobum]